MNYRIRQLSIFWFRTMLKRAVWELMEDIMKHFPTGLSLDKILLFS